MPSPRSSTPTRIRVPVLDEPEAVRARSRAWRREGLRVALVPTMGALHAGHLSLVHAARPAGADRVVVSIFVNPTQFGPGEDLDSYPRDLAGDLAKLAGVGADLVFAPPAGVVYPPRHQTRVLVDNLTQPLCGRDRPGHFAGVTTVVTILFNMVEPDIAVFGEKDFQQLRVLQQLARDLHLPVRVHGAPIVREPDGLAMSSRNAYLDPEERQRALCLSRALQAAARAVAEGERRAAPLLDLMRGICEEARGEVDYIAVVDEATLRDVERLEGPVRAALAVRIGKARLIDNARIALP